MTAADPDAGERVRRPRVGTWDVAAEALGSVRARSASGFQGGGPIRSVLGALVRGNDPAALSALKQRVLATVRIAQSWRRL